MLYPAGGDSKWCQDVVKRVNQDLNSTGLYDEFVFLAGHVPLFVATFTKDLDNVPPCVRLEDREELQTQSLLQTPVDTAPAATVSQGGGTGEQQGQEEEGQEEEEAVSYLQSRLNIPSVYIRSLCEHANMRLLTIDKSTRATTGVSTYLFEKKKE
jgi:hypothetical protein